jgi:hypothetical protein
MVAAGNEVLGLQIGVSMGCGQECFTSVMTWILCFFFLVLLNFLWHGRGYYLVLIGTSSMGGTSGY